MREALIERETLLRRHAAYRLADALRAAFPQGYAFRFDDAGIAASGRFHALVEGAAPGLADPAGGLFLYDHMGGRKLLPPTRAVDLTRATAGKALQACFTRAYAYSDVWVEDFAPRRSQRLAMRRCGARGS